jgi:hypothetical protein
MQTMDGEDVVITRTLFTVVRAARVRSALDGAMRDGLERADAGRWTWTGRKARGALRARLRLAARRKRSSLS